MSTSTITLYDLPSKHGFAWSPNPWKTRLLLNYKEIDYKTIWVEYPDVASTLSPHLPPSGFPRGYTIPTIAIPSSTSELEYIRDSAAIAARLEELYPSPSLHLDSPVLPQVYDLVPMIVLPLKGIWAHLVATHFLNPHSQEYFNRTRAQDLGKPLDELFAESNGEESWIAALPGIRAMGDLLKSTPGPFFMGETVSYADFVLLAQLQFFKQLDKGMYGKLVELEPAFGVLFESGKVWLERDDH